MARSDDNRFYLATSNHLGRGAQINLYEYRPGEEKVERVLDVSAALGWSKDMYTDGKIHGHMGIMPDGKLWAGTHYGPHPTEQWIADGYRGSWLFSYNINTKKATNWGVPLVVHNLACHTLDTQRGIFMATGDYSGMVLSWDVKAKKVRFAGYPPQGWKWWPRAMLLDEKTGIFWGMDSSEMPYRFLSFDPALNQFKRHEVPVPANPLTGAQGQLRGHTHHPDANGWYYYQPKGDNSPLVQYDVKTGKRKAIAFLQDYFFEKYGYWLGSQVYGLEISKDGSFVVIGENGTFAGRGNAFGHPALTVVSIPASERPLE